MTLRHAVEAALVAAEAAQLREVADVILTLSRQLDEERHRADVTEDHACELRAQLVQARIVAKDEFTARRAGLPLTEEMAATRLLRYPWLRRPWEEPPGGEEGRAACAVRSAGEGSADHPVPSLPPTHRAPRTAHALPSPEEADVPPSNPAAIER